MNYAVFTDESYITAHRFRSIAAYSFPYPILERVKDDIATLLRESSVKEFKWKELKGVKYKFCAIKIVDYVLRTVVEDDARVDVVTWDTQDSRHSVKNRNDDANFERMYFHLISASMERRPRESKWGVYPDEKNGIDWKTINKCLSATGTRTNSSISLFAELKQNFHVVELKQIESHNTPPSQVADLFAGLSVFSGDCYHKYSAWSRQQSPTLSLFEEEETAKLSNTERARFEVLKHLDEECKSRKFGVSLKSKRRLKTQNPKNPINFWFYQPQHEFDKAPTKNG